MSSIKKLAHSKSRHGDTEMGRHGDRRADEERRKQGDREIADCKLKT